MSITPKGLGPSQLELRIWERCEGEYGEVPDQSVVSLSLYLDEHMYLNGFVR